MCPVYRVGKYFCFLFKRNKQITQTASIQRWPSSSVANYRIEYGYESCSGTYISSSTGQCALETDNRWTVRSGEVARNHAPSRYYWKTAVHPPLQLWRLDTLCGRVQVVQTDYDGQINKLALRHSVSKDGFYVCSHYTIGSEQTF